jgi:hypothetical protein
MECQMDPSSLAENFRYLTEHLIILEMILLKNHTYVECHLSVMSSSISTELNYL